MSNQQDMEQAGSQQRSLLGVFDPPYYHADLYANGEQACMSVQTSNLFPQQWQDCTRDVPCHQPVNTDAFVNNHQAVLPPFHDVLQTIPLPIPMPHHLADPECYSNPPVLGQFRSSATYLTSSYPAIDYPSLPTDPDEACQQLYQPETFLAAFQEGFPRLPTQSANFAVSPFLSLTNDIENYNQVNHPSESHLDFSFSGQSANVLHDSPYAYLANSTVGKDNMGPLSPQEEENDAWVHRPPTIIPLSPVQTFEGISRTRGLEMVPYHGSCSTAMVPVKPRLKPGVRTTPCLPCRHRKIKCNKTGINSCCERCNRRSIPFQVSIQMRVTDYRPFEKWQNETYENQFTRVRSTEMSFRRTAELAHYLGGPFLLVECCKFLKSHHYQIEMVRKNSSGRHVAETTAFCLADPKINIVPYIQACIDSAISEACKRQNIVSTFFRIACSYRNEPIIKRCLEMYTALVLIMKGCQFSGTRKERTGVDDDYLGMTEIDDDCSAWSSCIPVPRMVTNQINHQLELRIKALDSEILKDAHNRLSNKTHRTWIVDTLAIFLILHIRELDAGRNIFWQRYEDPHGFWIHPSKPQALIQEAIASSNSLLSHFHWVLGRRPLAMDWDRKESRDMVDNDQKIIASMKELSAYVRKLEANGLLGRSACDLYEAGNPYSVEFTVSSLTFVKDIGKGCVVKGFY